MTDFSMRVTTVLVVCAAALLTIVFPTAQTSRPTASPESIGLNSSRLREASELLRRFVAERKITGAVASVARHGKVGYLEATGFQNLNRRRR